MRAGHAAGKGQPEYISKEQFYKECHISKRTALWLIQSGLVCAIDMGKRTNRYLIDRCEVKRYLHERELHPEKYRYTRGVAPSLACLEDTDQLINTKRTQAALQKIWEDEPDLLRIQDVSALLGYPEKRIAKWKTAGELRSIVVSHTLYFPKKYLLDFVLSPVFQAVSPKSSEHLELLRRIGYAGS